MLCTNIERPLVKPYQITYIKEQKVVVLVVPWTLSVEAGGELGLDITLIVCPQRLTLVLGFAPYFNNHITGGLALGIPLLSAGVTITFSTGYKLLPSVGTSSCNLCVVLNQEVQTITISIDGVFTAGPFKKSFNFYTFKGPTIKSTLFKYCLFPDRPYNPESVIGLPPIKVAAPKQSLPTESKAQKKINNNPPPQKQVTPPKQQPPKQVTPPKQQPPPKQQQPPPGQYPPQGQQQAPKQKKFKIFVQPQVFINRRRRGGRHSCRHNNRMVLRRLRRKIRNLYRKVGFLKTGKYLNNSRIVKKYYSKR